MRSRTMKLLSLALAVCLLLCGCNLIRTDPEYVKQQEAEKAAAEQAAYEADMATVLAMYYGDRVVTKGDAVDAYNEQMDMYSSYVTYMNYMASMFGISESQSITAEDAARVRDNVVKEIVKTRVLDQKMLDLGFAAFTEEELAAIQTDATNEYNTYVEKETSQGRIDCVLECPDYVYIFEFKLNSTAEAALKQIDEKGYAQPYAADKRKIYKVGISFSSETGTVNDFAYKPCE